MNPTRLLGLTSSALAALATSVAAQSTPSNAELLERLERIEQENRDLRGRVERVEGSGAASTGAAGGSSLERDLADLGAPGSAAGTSATDRDDALAAPGRALAQSGLSGAFGGLYTKPFLASSNGIALGGYMDFEFKDATNADRDFRFHRLIPFIYAQPSERVKFATEIEIEDGHELAVEFAVIDLCFADPFNFRAGVILSPLGKFNLVHDSPVNELTDRPLVDSTVIPTTLREAGFGAFGTLASADSSLGQLTYEAYLTGGFKGLLDDGTATFDRSNGLRNGRPHEEVGSERAFEDINNGFAGVARLEWSPTLGGVVGLSGHRGAYDESGENELTIVAVDGALDGRVVSRLLGASGATARVIDGFELLGEAAHASLQTDAFARAAGIPDRLAGWYVQLNYRLYPDFLRDFEQRGWLDRGSRFTLVARWDDVDLDGNERERLTFGLNFRPNQSQTVIKFDWQFNSESGNTVETRNDAFLASIATYF
ncbi:MAG: hypothetical protein JNL90_03560 [Planctomycetes bacterium]|nr:hypothetical protein [Planctomycetota bacterium]